MRRGVWFVLALMGGVPAGARAQAMDPSSASTPATQGDKQVWSCSAIGGSGKGAQPQISTGRHGEDIFVGTLRSLTLDRMVMADTGQRIFEFNVGAQTRIIGPRGEAIAPQALLRGMPVRAVTQEGDVRNEVSALQILVPAPVR